MLLRRGSNLNKTVVVKIRDSAIVQDDNALKDACELRKWCHANIKCEWFSYFLHTTDENRMENSVGFVAFEFSDPKEAMKFKLWAG
jgi:hypothetical protein